MSDFPRDPALIRRLLDSGRILTARAAVDAALHDAPDNVRLLQLAGRIAMVQDDAAAAAILLDRALEHAKGDAVLWVDRALAAGAMGEAKSFGRVLKRSGMPPHFAIALGDLATGRGASARGLGAADARTVRRAEAALAKRDFTTAEGVLRPALAKPGAKVLSLLAAARRGKGDPRGAAQALTAALKAEPWAAELRTALGEATARISGPLAALPHALEGVRLAPRSAPALLSAARLARAAGVERHAGPLADRALDLAPSDPLARRLGAEAALVRHDGRSAIRLASKLPSTWSDRTQVLFRAHAAARDDAAALDVLADATDTVALTLRGQLRQSMGDAEAAEADLRAAIAAEPANGTAHRALAYGTTLAEDDPALDVMRAQVDANPNARLVRYALARAIEPYDPDEAFDYLARANDLQAKAFPYDPKVDDAEWARLSGPLWDAVRTAPEGTATVDPIFVTGLPRSGTTLVESVLAAAPGITAGGELSVLQGALFPYYDALEAELRPDGSTAAAAYEAAARRRSGAEGRFTDKSIHTFLHLGALAAVMPQAAIVVVRRDPRDVALSMWRNHFPDGTQRYAATVDGIARHIALFDRVLGFWRDARPNAFHEIAYEDLLDDTEGQARALYDATGLEWTPDALSFHEKTRRIDTLSFAQVRRPVYRDSRGGWRKHEARIRPLLDALEARNLLPD
ncbi:tetratricopeptide repeat-containing sulfotransferase family protein [Jannaschia sp. LMIT008]|uniref:tetratricopeptide repeat-containing sulfotransferase family protein n=1 Tax=Jannaschia maritima TaxID=3032585 RepID=UPI0028118F35|nr:sulfotransferase [Jannaschia sp. LMIT008]